MSKKDTKGTYNNIYNNNIYIPLSEASKLCDYSQEYLSLRARQGKLKAIKQGRNWVTTKNWVERYLKDFNGKELIKKEENLAITPEKSLNDNILRTPISDLTRPFFSFVGSVLRIIPRIIPAVWGALLELFKSAWEGLSLLGSILSIIWEGLKNLLDQVIELRHFRPSINISQPIFKVPKIPSFNIFQPKVIISGILIGSLVFGFFFAFNSGARTALAEWADKSFETIVQTGEEMAEFVFEQSQNLVELTQTRAEKILETSSDVFNQVPQLIEKSTQAIKELPIKITFKIAQVSIPKISIPKISIPKISIPEDIPQKIYQKICKITQETNQNIDRWSQKNEQFKSDLKSGLAQLPQKIKELRVKTINVQNQTAEIIKNLPDGIKTFGAVWFQNTRTWVEGIPEWTQEKTSQVKTFALKSQEGIKNLPSNFSLSREIKKIGLSSVESIVQGINQFSENMTATVDVISDFSDDLGDETSQKVKGSVSGAIREVDKGLIGFVAVKNDVSASIFDKISDLNSELSQRITSATSKTKEVYGEAVDSLKVTQSKLGDTYLKVAEFLIPRYNIDWGVARVQQRLVQQVQPITQSITQPITQNITKQEITQVTQIVESADLTSIKNQISELETKIASKIDYTVPSYAPIYIPSSGLQVEGHSLLSTLNVSGSGSIGGSLSVRQNMSIGNTTDNITPTLTVNADSTFNKGLTVNSIGITSGLSIGDTLTVGGDSTFAGNVGVATTTITGDLIVQDSDGIAYFYVQNNTGNLGIGTTTPEYKFVINSSNATDNLFQIATTTNQQIFTIDNQGNLYLNGSSTTTGKAIFTYSPQLAGENNVEDSPIYINSVSAVSDANLLGIADNGTWKFRVDKEGDVFAAGNITTSGRVSQSDTSVLGNLTVEGWSIFGDAPNNDYTEIKGYTVIRATSTQTALTIDQSSSGDLLNILDDGTEIFTILDGGNVGIGASNPNQLLHLRGDASDTGLQGMIFESIGERSWEIGAKGTDDEGAFTIKDITVNAQRFDIQSGGHVIVRDGNLGIGTTSPLARLVVQASSTKPILNIASSTGASILYINSGGNVGIGTTGPTYKLEVVGTGTSLFRISDNVNATLVGEITSANLGTFKGTSGSALALGANDAEVMRLTTAGNVGIGTTNPTNLLVVSKSQNASTYVVIDNDTDGTAARSILRMEVGAGNTGMQLEQMSASYTATGMRKADSTLLNTDRAGGISIAATNATADIRFYTAGSVDGNERMVIKSNGNVGIGVTTPAALLNVQRGTGGTDPLFQVGTSTSAGMLVVKSNGNVGIGTTSPGVKLHVYGASTGIASIEGGSSFADLELNGGAAGDVTYQLLSGYPNAGDFSITESGLSSRLVVKKTSGNVGIGDTDPDALLDVKGTVCLDLNADEACTDNTSAISDARLKTNVTDINNGLQLIQQLRPVRFTWNGEYNVGTANSLGFLAQEVETIFPELVITDTAGYKNLDYGKLTAVLTSAIQELSASTTKIYDVIDMTNASTTAPSMYILNNGNFGIATDTPTHILTVGQGMGNAIADGWEVYSSREYKTDITYLEEKDYQDILNEIEGMDIATYRWKTDSVVENTSTSTNLGVIAEEAPEQVLSENGKSISLYDYATFAIAGVKALKTKVDELAATLEANGYLSDSSALPQTDTALSGLVIDEEGYAIIDKIKSKYIETENLKVRAENSLDSGITIYDSKTGDPYCLYIEYGAPMTRSGECSTVLNTPVEVATSTDPVIVEEPVATTTPEVIVEEPVATTTPEVIIEPIPIVEEVATTTPSISTSTPAVIVE